MKKEYIKPNIYVVSVETESLLAASNYEEMGTTDLHVWSDESVTPESALSKDHNGIWD